MIKVANLTASISRKGGGLYDAVMRLAQSHDQQKIDERAFGLRDEFTEADLAQWSPVPVEAFEPIGMFKPIGYSPKFNEALEQFAPDICHTHGLWVYPSMAVKKYSRKSERPYLISPHGMLDSWALKNSRWKKQVAWHLFESAHLRGAKCLRALCASEAESIRKLKLGNPIMVIPNGIDLPESGKRKAESGHAPWVGKVDSSNKVLLFLSRIHPKKGLVNLLKAWAAIPNRYGWVLAIAGWDQGGHERELKRLCSEQQIPFADLREPTPNSQLPASILFLGSQFNEAKLACYAQCDAFVLPSFSEGLPMVVLEAWANSKPVMMTPECNLPEGFQAGAALNMASTEAGVIDGLNQLLRMSEADRMAMGARARALVELRFTWPKIATQIEEVYLWMLGDGPRPKSFYNAC